MPKKRSVKTWRKSETGEEFRTTVEESIHQEALEKESNENLFFIDTGGNEKTKKKLIDEDENRGLTKYEQAKIEKLVEQKKNAGKPKAKAQKKQVFDLWNQPVDTSVANKNEWLTRKESVLPLKSIHPPKLHKPTKHAAVPTPIPGSSYNPDFDYHQDALGEALNREIHYEEKKQKQKELPGGARIEDVLSYKMTVNAEDEALLNSESEEEEEHDDGLSVLEARNKPVEVKIKTKAQRHREAKQRKEMRLAQYRKKQRQFDNDLKSIKSIVKNMELDKEAEKKKKKEIKDLHNELKKREKNTIFGCQKCTSDQLPDLDVYLTEELPQSMRQMPNISNPVMDRMQSLERRRLIEKGHKVTSAELKKMRASRIKYKSPFLKM